MNTNAEEQKPTPKKKDKLFRILITLIAALSIFIVICLSLTIFIITRQQPAQPKPLVLRHPSDAMVPAGVSRADLEKAMELSKDWAAAHIKGAAQGAAEGDFGQAREDSLGNLYSLDELLRSGRIARIANGTRCVMVDSGWTFCQVRITDGPLSGQNYWVYRRCLGRVRNTTADANAEISEELFCGAICASVYIRYFITAAICCAGIYALKLKSMFAQIVLFIIAMALLNLLSARIAMLLIV